MYGHTLYKCPAFDNKPIQKLYGIQDTNCIDLCKYCNIHLNILGKFPFGIIQYDICMVPILEVLTFYTLTVTRSVLHIVVTGRSTCQYECDLQLSFHRIRMKAAAHFKALLAHCRYS